MTLNTAEAFGLAVVVAFVYAAWRVADYFGAHFAWVPW
jgi:hypothetical protein